MNDQRRASRADRRRAAGRMGAPERRNVPPNSFNAYSQIVGQELQIYTQSIVVAENCAAAREQLHRHFARAKSPVVVLDLQKTTYIDTIGLSLVFELKREMEAQGRTFLLQNPSRCVLRMLNITRMIRVFQVRMTNADLALIPHAKPGDPPITPARADATTNQE